MGWVPQVRPSFGLTWDVYSPAAIVFERKLMSSLTGLYRLFDRDSQHSRAGLQIVSSCGLWGVVDFLVAEIGLAPITTETYEVRMAGFVISSQTLWHEHQPTLRSAAVSVIPGEPK